MPYQKRYRKKYQGRRRMPYYTKAKKLVTGQGPTLLEKIASYAGPVASVAKAVLPAIAAINTESKFLDTVSSGAGTFAAPVIFNLSLMAQGLTESTRVGNSILAKDLTVRTNVGNTWLAADDGYPAKMRIVLFVDKTQAGVAPTLANLMQDTANHNSSFNKNNTDRFVILKDKMNVHNPPSRLVPAGGVQEIFYSKIFKKLDFHIRYIGTSAAAASAGQNQLYIMFWPTFGSGTQVNGSSVYARLNYTDN